jgi:hypothetical protein
MNLGLMERPVKKAHRRDRLSLCAIAPFRIADCAAGAV